MDINMIYEFIAQVGFPIAMCAALFWKMNEQDRRHDEQITELTKVVNSNTVALTKLTDKLEEER